MKLLRQIRGFLRAFRAGPSVPATDEDAASLARTIKESTHANSGFGGPARATTDAQEKIVVEGHRDYTDSFKD